MSWRTVIISSQAKLDYKMGYIVVRSQDTKRILLDEVSVLVLENPMVSLTGYLIEKLTEKKIKVIFCDSKRNPKLFITLNLQDYISDSEMNSFLESVLNHNIKLFMIECRERDKLIDEYRFIIDSDLCEIC